MGEDEFDIKTGAMCFYDEQKAVYKSLMPVTELPEITTLTDVDDVKSAYPSIVVDTPEGSFTCRTSAEVAWWIRMGCERIKLAGYMYVRGGTDRRRIKRHKRRIRMFKVKQKIAQARGQL